MWDSRKKEFPENCKRQFQDYRLNGLKLIWENEQVIDEVLELIRRA